MHHHILGKIGCRYFQSSRGRKDRRALSHYVIADFLPARMVGQWLHLKCILLAIISVEGSKACLIQGIHTMACLQSQRIKDLLAYIGVKPHVCKTFEHCACHIRSEAHTSELQSRE